MSTAGMALLKKSEGFRSHTYLDAAGIPTIGYGHRILASESFPSGIDEPEGARMLERDVESAEQAVKRLVRVDLTQGQFDALVDFVYNLGWNKFAASELLQDLNRGRYDAAAEQLLRWDHQTPRSPNSRTASRSSGLR
jgi:lysozyme